MTTTTKRLPGTLWLNRGRWNWKVRLPGTPARRNYPLRLPGQPVALPEAKRNLAESVAWRMWERASRFQPAKSGASVEDAAAAWIRYADTYYRHPDDTPTREARNCELAIRHLRSLYGTKQLDDLAFQDIQAAREGLIDAGLARETINKRVGAWKRFAKWALENRLCAPATVAEITALAPLKPYRSKAHEPEPIRPVSHLDVKRTLPYLPPSLQAMVRLAEFTGARPAEVCAIRLADIDTRRPVWIYRPATHKTAHRGRPRIIAIGPRAQAVLSPYLEGDPGKPVFSPVLATRERREAARAARKTSVQPSQMNRAKQSPKRAPGCAWTASGFAKAIRRASVRACGDGHIASPWHPNQLRHACGTRVRRKFGPESASAVLGHAAKSARVTDIYTHEAIERELIATASRVMRVVG